MNFNKQISFQNRLVGQNHPPYLIAEISANHNGSIDIAMQSILSAKKSGADAIKLQCYTPDTMTIHSNKDDFLIKEGNWKGQNLYDLYKEAHTPFEWHKPLFDYAKKLGITIFSSVFDETSVDLLESLNVCAYKIASFEATDYDLISYVCSKQKPVIISTGMSNYQEISDLIKVCQKSKNKNIILLHCVSSYPAKSDLYNLKIIKNLEENFNILVGLSDHTIDNIASITSVPLGCCMIEKHFILDRKLGGPDSEFSIEPLEFKKLKKDVIDSYMSMGEIQYDLKGQEKFNIIFRRSIYAVADIKKGEKFTTSNIKKIRPGFGLEPKKYNFILGKYANRDIDYGDPIIKDCIKDY